MDTEELIKSLSEARGASGYEDEVVDLVKAYVSDFAEVREDSMRNLIITPRYNRGDRPLVMLDAHSDEVGFMVQAIKPDGTLRFIPIGGWDERILPASAVQVYTEKGYIRGAIAATPPHLQTAAEKGAALGYDRLCIDVGARSDEEAKEMGVETGAPVLPLTPFYFNGERGLLHGKAFDDRMGAAAMLECLRELASERLSVDVVGVLSSQEEVGDRGIKAVMYRVKADAAICFEGCPADDTVAPPYMIQDRLHGGVMLRHMDRTVICTPRFTRFARQVAAEKGIPVQMAVRSGGGNNGEYIISANGATPVIVAGIPVRYIHSFNCIAAYDDYLSVKNFGRELVKALDADTIKNF